MRNYIPFWVLFVPHIDEINNAALQLNLEVVDLTLYSVVALTEFADCCFVHRFCIRKREQIIQQITVNINNISVNKT